ncbi:uncharacterized protein BP5553_10028 [Venustampulla echinocandica]|uniref:Uncharacterized protein n=1 Tax=Venustampulla echinocandica TaxID=2656787 RepID=A0A370TA40_9HELO|nr:uncharacterized protein BP5553_10028 [Venustampulla echinocandica]RDL30683.1 hypothetical protein BP5553_10028 [Venustampulla echinocandica]
MASAGATKVEDTDLTGGSTTIAVAMPWKALWKIEGRDWFSSDLSPSDGKSPASTITFRLPDQQRASTYIRISCPRNMSKYNNPRQAPNHVIGITIPASKVKEFTYEDLPGGYIANDGDKYFVRNGQNFTQHNGEPFPLGVSYIKASGAYISGAKVPILSTNEMTHSIIDLIKSIRISPISTFYFLIRRQEDMTNLYASNFQYRIANEAVKDPLQAWINDSPNTDAITMGNLVKAFKRPNIPIQCAELVYEDRNALQVAQIYASLYEEE